MTWHVTNFYRFVELEDPEAMRKAVYDLAFSEGLVGSMRVAKEGINGGFATETEWRLARFEEQVSQLPGLAGLEFKRSIGRQKPYDKLIVRVRPTIVRFAEEEDPSIPEIEAGPRVTPEEFRALLERGDAVIIDTRNVYETDYGFFEGAVTLPIRKFVEFPKVFLERFGEQKDKTYLFYCTGGIRCEKAVPWALKQGFKDVRQLDGGILRYFEREGSKGWKGTCFVFDHRWILDPARVEADDDQPDARRQPKPQAALAAH